MVDVTDIYKPFNISIVKVMINPETPKFVHLKTKKM